MERAMRSSGLILIPSVSSSKKRSNPALPAGIGPWFSFLFRLMRECLFCMSNASVHYLTLRKPWKRSVYKSINKTLKNRLASTTAPALLSREQAISTGGFTPAYLRISRNDESPLLLPR
jgi:hypothetical protein